MLDIVYEHSWISRRSPEEEYYPSTRKTGYYAYYNVCVMEVFIYRSM